ncbi:MAG: hypothetical protein IT306_25995 [Chloroflexi bacterium]|nr:hypothetical protein [Chloroflexota bacterium]
MRAIQTRGKVSEDRKLTVDLPADIQPGDHRVVVVIDESQMDDLAAVAQTGGAFDWLHDEPDLYNDEDGERV